MNVGKRKTITASLALALLGGTHLGCSTATKSTNKHVKPSGPAHKHSESVDPNASTASHSQSLLAGLVIHGETIAPDDIWRGLDAELAEQTKTRTPEGFEAYVAKRATQLIRDRIAQALLIRQASLRMPEDFDQQLNGYVDGQIRKIVTSDHDGRQRRYEKWLASRGETLEEVRTQLRKDLLISSYLDQEIRPKVLEPTRAELLAEYKASLDSLRRPARRRMSLIETRVSERLPKDIARPTKEQVNAARNDALTKIHTARTALENGGDFADIANRHSDGLHASEGGAWGWITRGSVRERFEPAVDALFNLDEGEASGIVEGGDGFFLVRCEEIDEPATPDFETLQPQLADRYFKMQYNRLVMERVAKLQQQAHIAQDDLNRFYVAVIEAGIKRIAK